MEATPGIEPGCTDLQSMRQVRITKDLAANSVAFRRLIDGGSKLGLNEPEPGRYAKH